MRIGIVGAGHAGVAAAQAAAKMGNEVTLFSNENSLPYFRPRMPAVAFGQADVEAAIMHPLDWYKKQSIDLKLNEPVKKLTVDKKIINDSDKEYSFDKVIITAGAVPIIPPFAKVCKTGSVIPLWNIEHAQAIRKKIDKIKKLAIIGGGVIGIEAALRAADVGLDVTIIERLDNLMERNLSNKASELLAYGIKDKGIKIFTGHTVESIDDSSSSINIVTDKKNDIKADLVILSIGNTFNMRFTEPAGLQKDKAIIVDSHMQSSNENFFAAGDMAQLPDIINICSAIKAVKQGKVVGINSSVVSDKEMSVFEPEPISVMLKYGGFQLYTIGKTPNNGLQEEILEDKANEIYRAIIKEDGKIVGIQMIGSLTDYKKFEKELLIEQ